MYGLYRSTIDIKSSARKYYINVTYQFTVSVYYEQELSVNY